MAERRARRRPKNAPSLEKIKADIDAREQAAAERKAQRKAEREASKKSLTPAEKYEQEKAARARRGSSGYAYSQHLMGGSSSSSGSNPRSVREEVLVDYLLGEGFASDEKSAQAIAGAMSEEWVQSIVEGEEKKEESQKSFTGEGPKKPKGWKPTGPKLKTGQRPGYAR